MVLQKSKKFKSWYKSLFKYLNLSCPREFMRRRRSLLYNYFNLQLGCAWHFYNLKMTRSTKMTRMESQYLHKIDRAKYSVSQETAQLHRLLRNAYCLINQVTPRETYKDVQYFAEDHTLPPSPSIIFTIRLMLFHEPVLCTHENFNQITYLFELNRTIYLGKCMRRVSRQTPRSRVLCCEFLFSISSYSQNITQIF